MANLFQRLGSSIVSSCERVYCTDVCREKVIWDLIRK